MGRLKRTWKFALVTFFSVGLGTYLANISNGQDLEVNISCAVILMGALFFELKNFSKGGK